MKNSGIRVVVLFFVVCFAVMSFGAAEPVLPVASALVVPPAGDPQAVQQAMDKLSPEQTNKVQEILKDPVKQQQLQQYKAGKPLAPQQRALLDRQLKEAEVAKSTLRTEENLPDRSEIDVIDNKKNSVEDPAVTTAADEAKKIGGDKPAKLLILSPIQNRYKTTLPQFGYGVFNNASKTFAPLSNVPVGDDYILGPGDEINLFMWGNLQQQMTLVLDTTGSIVLPKVGRMSVGNMSLGQAKKIIERSLNQVFANFTMDITMGRLRVMPIFLLGEVNGPGQYLVGSTTTLFHALFEAGGIQKTGSLRSIRLVRKSRLIAVIDLYKFLLEGNKRDDYALQQGDVVFVDNIMETVLLQGEIKRPAIYEFKDHTTLAELIDLAGGFTKDSYYKKVNIISREDDLRKVNSFYFKDVNDLQKNAKTIQVENGDVVSVEAIEGSVMGFVNIAGNVMYPGDFEYKPNMIINQLIQKAGGLKPFTYTSRAELTRFDTANKLKLIVINLEDKNQLNIPLQTGDLLRIYSDTEIYPSNRVGVLGYVDRPGTYMLKNKMTLSDLIFTGGGIKPKTYLDRAELTRLDKDNRKKLVVINLADKQTLAMPLEDGDVLRLYSESEIFPGQKVSISGFVDRPGIYDLKNKMTLSDLLFSSGGVKPTTYLPRAEIVRFNPHDYSLKLITINLQSIVLTGNVSSNSIDPLMSMVLEPEDWVRIYAVSDVYEAESISILGYVKQPGSYPFERNMTIKDLLFMAGGVSYLADQSFVEVFGYSEGKMQCRKLMLTEQTMKSIQLNSRDIIYIRKKIDFIDKVDVTISGEVNYPGAYSVRRDSHLSDVLALSGGLTNLSFLKGLTFYRQTSEDLEKTKVNENVDGLVPIEQISSTRINLKIDNVDSFAGSNSDLLLQDGDRIVVPKINSVIVVKGGIFKEGVYAFQQGYSVNDYVQSAGGLVNGALLDQIYVVDAAGFAIRDAGLDYRVQMGDTVIVPAEKVERKDPLKTWLDFSQVVFNIAAVWKVVFGK